MTIRGVVLDTNVLSEFSRPTPDREVERWCAAHRIGDLWTTSVSIGEIRRGLSLMPAGARRSRLELWFDSWLMPAFHGRIRAFDAEAAIIWADMATGGRARDFRSSALDLQIAAIAKAGNFRLSTRNTSDFAKLDVETVNPWVPGAAVFASGR